MNDVPPTPADPALVDALRSSQRLGMLGDRPVHEAVEHAWAFVDALRDVTGTVVDLGAGGGVPGLVIAVARPDLHLVLVDRRTRRTDHLQRLVIRLALSARVEVLAVDATELAGSHRAAAAAVVARSFGPPAVVLRTATPLLVPGGRLIVSEPPPSRDIEDRWPPALLDRCGVRRVPSDPRVAVLVVRVSRGT